MDRPYSTHPKTVAQRKWYARAKTAQRPSYFAALARSTAWLRALQDEEEFAGSRVACCGAFHPITHLPFTAPCCGAVYFEEVHHVG